MDSTQHTHIITALDNLKSYVNDIAVDPTTPPVVTPPSTTQTKGKFFVATSMWNRDAPDLKLVDDYRTALMRGDGFYFNVNNGYGVPLYYAKNTDPKHDIHAKDHSVVGIHLPAGVKPTTGTDKNWVVIDPDGGHEVEVWEVTDDGSGNWTAGSLEVVDLTAGGMDNGIRGADWPLTGGLITIDEMAAGVINHALMLGIKHTDAQKGWVPPANGEDGDNKGYRDTGGIPLGTFFAISRSINIHTQGLSSEGVIIADALQRKGAYVGDTGSQYFFQGQVGIPQSTVDKVIADLPKIKKLLQVTA